MGDGAPVVRVKAVVGVERPIPREKLRGAHDQRVPNALARKELGPADVALDGHAVPRVAHLAALYGDPVVDVGDRGRRQDLRDAGTDRGAAPVGPAVAGSVDVEAIEPVEHLEGARGYDGVAVRQGAAPCQPGSPGPKGVLEVD